MVETRLIAANERRERNWIAEATGRLQNVYNLIRCDDGLDVGPMVVIKPALDAAEAEYFVRGLEGGVFCIDDQGYVQSPALPASSPKGTRNKILQLFWRRSGRLFLFREGVCQVATVAAFALKYGWRLDQIQMEPTLPCLRWAVDIALKDRQGAVIALCEVKRDDRELNQLIRGFRCCCSTGMHLKEECRFGKNHPKYEACAASRPDYFIAVSPGREICFHLSYSGALISIDEVAPTSLTALLREGAVH